MTFAAYLKSTGSFIEGIVGVNLLAFISASDMGRSFESFGFMIIGGMASAAVYLLAVPVFYSLIDDAQKGASKYPRHCHRPLAQAKRGGVTYSAWPTYALAGYGIDPILHWPHSVSPLGQSAPDESNELATKDHPVVSQSPG